MIEKKSKMTTTQTTSSTAKNKFVVMTEPKEEYTITSAMMKNLVGNDSIYIGGKQTQNKINVHNNGLTLADLINEMISPKYPQFDF